MKKFLLLTSAALLASQTMFAISSPKEYAGAAFAGISPDGTLAVSQLYGDVVILNVETNQEFSYNSDFEYSVGSGRFISNNRIVVGQKGGTAACYWKDGEWTLLPGDRMMSIAYGITRDGSRIVGALSPQGFAGGVEGLMLTPCYWDVQSDGTFGDPVLLPFPDKDLTGRVPQYVTAVAVSYDGKTIAGQITDFGGMVYQPIVYTCGSDGKWEWSLPQNDLYHPEGFVMPEDPGEAPDVLPENFMSDEEYLAYQAAVDKYWEVSESLIFPEHRFYMTSQEWAAYEQALEDWDGDFDTYPMIEDFMTEEELKDYEDAVNQYYEDQAANVYPDFEDYMTPEELAAYEEAKKKMEAWDEAWMEFAMAYGELIETVPNFVFNNVFISPDGKYYYSTYMKEGFDPMTWEDLTVSYPYEIDLKTNKSEEYANSDYNLILSSMTDNGTMLAQKPATMTEPVASAYIKEKDSKKFEPLYDFFVKELPSVGTWIKENMTHTYTSYEYDEVLGEVIETEMEIMPTGIPFTNSDLSVIGLAVENFWEESDIQAYGYLLPCVGGAFVDKLADDTAEVTALRGGLLKFEGSFEKAVVYDLNGYEHFNVKNPSGLVETGLDKGVYFLKAKTSDGRDIVCKILF